MRLIDGHELKKTFEAWRERLMQKAEMKLDVVNVWATERQIELIDAAIDELERMPEIREEPARHGRWIEGCCELRCSACRWKYSDELPFMSTHGLDSMSEAFAYCPHCGARMEEAKA